MGFEAEFSPVYSQWRKWIDKNEIPCDKIPESISECFYFKEDASCGMEMNSFPFNYNWFVNNKDYLKRSIGFLRRRGSVNRNCGFHVHIARKFFTKEHTARFCNFFYDNKEFFAKISLRSGLEGLRSNASFEDKHGKYTAVNKLHRKTLEVRIFQGTLNWRVASAYLETIYSIAMYTKHDLKPTLDKYKVFLKEAKIYKDGQWLVNNHTRIHARKAWKA